MIAYVDAPSDVAFTLWLATRDKRKVLAERHAHMTKPEKQILRMHEAAMPKPTPVVRQGFTDRQITIALAAMDARENTKSRSK